MLHSSTPSNSVASKKNTRPSIFEAVRALVLLGITLTSASVAQVVINIRDEYLKLPVFTSFYLGLCSVFSISE